MASDFTLAAPRTNPLAGTWIVEVAFVGFLLLVFVGLTPFAPRFPEVLALGEDGVTGKGDSLRQICYLAVFATITFATFRKYGLQAIAFVPTALSLVLLWCLASATWAAQGDVTFRRAGLEVIIVLTAIWSVEALGIERVLKLFRLVLAGILIVDWISIPLIHTAIHQSGELDPALSGAWRGLYFHKNIAGAVCAISAMVFLYFAVERKSRIDWLLFVAAVVFLVMTKSKSSMGLLVPALAAGFVYRAAWKRGIDRGIAALVVLMGVVLGATLAVVDWSVIERVISDPQEFTGRAAIWQAEIAFIADHPVLGSGFGSFTNTGGISPLHSYVGGDWIETIAHGHNGYLQLGLEIGAVGFLLTFFAAVVQPAVAFWKRDAIPIGFKAFLFSLFVFLVFHNVMESDFLQGDSQGWVTLLMLVAMMRQAKAVIDHQSRSASWA